MRNKILSMALVLLMLICSFSVTAFAVDPTDPSVLAEENAKLKDENAQLKKELDELKKEKPASLSPNVIISASSFGKGSVSGGKPFNFSYTLKNTSPSITIENVIVKVGGGEVFTIAAGTDTAEITKIPANGTVSKTISLVAGVSKDSGTYPVNLNISFEYYDNQKKMEGKAELSVAVPLSQEDKFSVNNIGMGKEVFVDREQNVTFTLVNTGATAMKNVYVTVLDDQGKAITSSFYGSVEPSAQAEDASKLLATPTKEGENKYTLKIEYEDKLSNKKVYTKDFVVNAMIYENPYDGMVPSDDGNKADSKEHKSNKKWIYISSAAGVVLVAAIVTVVVVKKKKAKKMDIYNEEL